jgi:hypothetical protein
MYKADFTKQIILAVAILTIADSALAQPLSGPSNYDVKNMSFDAWCQETQHYPTDRCEARRPEDLKAFEDYRALIERYELDHLKRVQQGDELWADINRDPTQTTQNLEDASPYPSSRR